MLPRLFITRSLSYPVITFALGGVATQLNFLIIMHMYMYMRLEYCVLPTYHLRPYSLI